MIEVQQYIVILRKWWWLVVLGLLLGGSTGYIAGRFEPKLYQTKATLLVGNFVQSANPNPSELATSQQLARSYAEIIKREPILRAAVENLGLNINWAGLGGKISTNLVPNTQLFEIIVVDGDPYLAKALADELVRQLILQSPSAATPEEEAQQAFVRSELQELQNNITQTRQQIQARQATLDLEVTAEGVHKMQQEIDFLQARLSNLQSTFASLLQLSQEKSINNLTVIEPAGIPSAPVNAGAPLKNIFLGGLFGLILTAGVAYLVEQLDNTIKTPEEVDQVLNLPTLSVVSHIKPLTTKNQQGVTTEIDIFSPGAEAYRILRTNIQYANPASPIKTLLVTSSVNGEGKSLTAANLAVVMSQANKRVILVDTDLRRPVLHKIFKVSNRVGVSSLLLNQGPDLELILARRKTGNLWVLPCGPLPLNPAELLSSPQMQSLLAQLCEHADMVIFDCPPLLPIADASILAPQVDATVFVVEAGKTNRQVCRRGHDILTQVGVKPLGVILNKFNPQYGGNGYYYTHRYDPPRMPGKVKAEFTNGKSAQWNSLIQSQMVLEELKSKIE